MRGRNHFHASFNAEGLTATNGSLGIGAGVGQPGSQGMCGAMATGASGAARRFLRTVGVPDEMGLLPRSGVPP